MLIVLFAALITIALTLRTKTGRRFWTGQLLDPNLDQFNRSTFFTGDPTGVSPWTRASVAHRITIRCAAIALPVLYTIGFITHPHAAGVIAATTAALIAAWLTWNTWQWARTRQTRRMKHTLFAGVQKTVGWETGIKPDDVILAANNYQQTGITLQLPDDFQRLDPVLEHTEQIASRTLGGNWEAHWNLAGQPTVQLQHTPEPPDQVTWDE